MPCFFYVLSSIYNINNKKFFIFLSFLLISIVVGCRHQIGGDWENYLFTFNNSNNYAFFEYLLNNYKHSFLYSTIEWILKNINFSIHFLNFICALIFSYGLIIFCMSQKNIYIGMLTATPVLVVSTAMGYTKQSVSIGILLLFLSNYKSLIKGFLLTAFAISFHFPSFFIILIYFFKKNITKKEIICLLTILIIVACIFYYQLMDYLQYYILDKYQGKLSYLSGGAIYRLFLNLIPSIIFIVFYNKFKIVIYSNFWLLVSIINIFLFILLMTNPELSTFIDRVGLYLLPIQILVFANLQCIVNNAKILFRLNLLTISYYFLILTLWLNFSYHKTYWVPYKTMFSI